MTAPRVLAIGIDPEQRVALLNTLRRVTSISGDAMLVVPEAAPWLPVARAIAVIDLQRDERRSGLNPWVLRWRALLAGLLVLVAVLPVPLASPLKLLAALFASVVAAFGVTRLPLGLDPEMRSRWMASGAYNHLRAWHLSLAFRAHLARVDPATLDQIVLRDVRAWGIAWRLLRVNPRIAVGASVEDNTVAPGGPPA